METNYAMPTNQFAGSPAEQSGLHRERGQDVWLAWWEWRLSWVDTLGHWVIGTVGRPVPFTPIQAPTPQQVADYLTGLPAGNPNAPESHIDADRARGLTDPCDNVTTNPVTPSQIAPTVKPASQVTPTDTVIDPNAPAPAGAQPPVPATQTTTTTTTTTTNPDGSTTTQDEDDSHRVLFGRES